MLIACEERSGGFVVSLSGRLDTLTAAELDKAGKSLLEEGRLNVVLDLDDLEYVSSAGLRSILALAKSLKAKGGKLVLCNVKGMVEEVLSMSGFDSFLSSYPDLDGALEGL